MPYQRHTVVMSRSWKVAAATVLIIIGVGGAVKAINFLGTEGLDRAEKWISIAGVVVSTGIGIGGLLSHFHRA
jgi:hypothetical protein